MEDVAMRNAVLLAAGEGRCAIAVWAALETGVSPEAGAISRLVYEASKRPRLFTPYTYASTVMQRTARSRMTSFTVARLLSWSPS